MILNNLSCSNGATLCRDTTTALSPRRRQTYGESCLGRWPDIIIRVRDRIQRGRRREKIEPLSIEARSFAEVIEKGRIVGVGRDITRTRGAAVVYVCSMRLVE